MIINDGSFSAGILSYLAEVAWAFSIYLEAIAIVPQLIMLQVRAGAWFRDRPWFYDSPHQWQSLHPRHAHTCPSPPSSSLPACSGTSPWRISRPGTWCRWALTGRSTYATGSTGAYMRDGMHSCASLGANSAPLSYLPSCPRLPQVLARAALQRVDTLDCGRGAGECHIDHRVRDWKGSAASLLMYSSTRRTRHRTCRRPFSRTFSTTSRWPSTRARAQSYCLAEAAAAAHDDVGMRALGLHLS